MFTTDYKYGVYSQAPDLLEHPTRQRLVPADDRIRPHHEKGRTPVGPEPGEPDPEDSVTLTELRTLGIVPQNRELLTKGDVLCGEIMIDSPVLER